MNTASMLIPGILIFFTVSNLYFIHYAKNRIEISGASVFIGMCASVAIFTFGYTMELLSVTKEQALWWNGFQYLGIPLIYYFGMAIALKYTGRDAFFKSRWTIWGLALPVLIIWGLRYSNGYHQMFYSATAMVKFGDLSILHLEKGPLHVLSMLYLGFCASISVIVFTLYKLTQDSGDKKIWVVLLAILLPSMGAVLNATNLAPFGLDFSALTITIGTYLLMINLFRYRLFDWKPIQREQVFHFAQEGILIIDRSNRVIDFNEAALSIFPELTVEELPLALSSLSPQFLELLISGTGVEFSVFKPEGMMFYSASMTPLSGRNKHYSGALILLTDITNLVSAKLQLEKASLTDVLTGADNRRAIYQKLRHENQLFNRYDREYALLMLDIDYFKRINDTYGHLAGDYILQCLVERVRQLVRGTDSVGRFGGEEFIVLLPETTKDQAIILAERIRAYIEEDLYEFEQNQIKMTVSIGVSSCRDLLSIDENETDSLLKIADEALYEAKRNGRNKVQVYM